MASRHIAGALLTLTVAMAPARSLRAGDGEPRVTFTAAQVEAKRIPLGPDAWKAIAGKTPKSDLQVELLVDKDCTLMLSSAAITPKEGKDCKALWSSPNWMNLKATAKVDGKAWGLDKDDISLVLVPDQTSAATWLGYVDGMLRLTGADNPKLKTEGHVYFFDSAAGSWKKVTAESGADRFEPPESMKKLLASGLDVYIDFDINGALIPGEHLRRVKLKESEPAKKNDGNGGGKKLQAAWCPAAPAVGSAQYVVCVDAYGTPDGKSAIVVKPKTNHVLLPNQSVRVVVRYPEDAAVEMAMEGDQGLFVPADNNLTAPPSAEGNKAQGAKEVGAAVRDQEFAPRKPGNANVTVTVKRGNADPQTYTVEFIVEETYLGAIRLGVGMIGGGAVDRSYEARTMPGSKQSEVALKSRGKIDLELVLGYSPYLDKSGRGYVTGCYPACFGPYFGLGVLNQSATGLETLKSLYAGFEWEPTPNFSVGFTVVGRRVSRLAPGFAIGSPVTGDVPTTTSYELGWGFVVNFSPEFLRIARGAGSGFFK